MAAKSFGGISYNSIGCIEYIYIYILIAICNFLKHEETLYNYRAKENQRKFITHLHLHRNPI